MLHDKAFHNGNNPLYDGYPRENLFQCFTSFLIKNLMEAVLLCAPIQLLQLYKITPNQQLIWRNLFQKVKISQVIKQTKYGLALAVKFTTGR